MISVRIDIAESERRPRVRCQHV